MQPLNILYLSLHDFIDFLLNIMNILMTQVHCVKQETMNRFMMLLVQSSDNSSKQTTEINSEPKSELLSTLPICPAVEDTATLGSKDADHLSTGTEVNQRTAVTVADVDTQTKQVESFAVDQIQNGRVQEIDTEEIFSSSVKKLQRNADTKACNNNNNNNLAAASSLALLGASGLQGLSQCRQINSIRSQNELGIISPALLMSNQSPRSDNKVSPQLRSLKTELCNKVDYNFNTWNDEMESVGELQSTDERKAYETYISGRLPTEAYDSYETQAHRCHRCRLGYPNALYLQLHKRSEEHKGRKRPSVRQESASKRQSIQLPSASTPKLEKSAEDVQRPFKCDVCMESFSEARGILAHYGTTPHMLKLQQHQESRKNTSGAPTDATDAISNAKLQSRIGDVQSTSSDSQTCARSNGMSVLGGPPQHAGLMAIASQGLAHGDVAVNDRPYRCDLCKVCYSLKQQLMTHMKSVQHQSRSAKLMTAPHSASSVVTIGGAGKPTYSQNPLLPPMDSEQTNYINNWLRAQNQFMTQTQNTGNGQFSPSLLPMLGASGMLSGFGLTNLAPTQHAILTKTNFMPPTPEENVPVIKRSHQQNSVSGKVAGKREENLGPETTASIQTIGSELQSSVLATRKYDSYGKLSHNSLVKFLENVGFECVIQFNENRQKVKKVISVGDTSQAEQTSVASNLSDNDSSKPVCEINDTRGVKTTDVEMKVEKSELAPDLPELQKSTCAACQKEFSSVWVLKAHEEEVHKNIVSHDDVAAFAVELRESLERKKKKVTKKTVPVKTEPEVTRTRVVDKKLDHHASQKITAPVEENVMPQYPQMTPSQAAQMMQYPLLLSMSMMSPMLSMMMPPQDFYKHSNHHNSYPGMDPSMAMRILQQQQQQQPRISPPKQFSAVQSANNQKAARTRINEQQLAILREHFDIHNSPGDIQIREMSERTTLPAKVIKHWFRNTLFKERQRNKDSPYNFNVVPLSTSLALQDFDGNGIINAATVDTKVQLNSTANAPIMIAEASSSSKTESLLAAVKTEPKSFSDIPFSGSANTSNPSVLRLESMHAPVSCSWSPGHSLANSNMSLFHPSSLQTKQQNSMGGQVGPLLMPTSQPWQASTASSGGSSYGGIGDNDSRTNRTRFNEPQVNELQELFLKNSYPSDEELSVLAERLNLNLRIVATWFQNARQKMRRAVEKIPNVQSLNTSREKMETCSETDSVQDATDANKQVIGTISNVGFLSSKVCSDNDNENDDDGELQIVEVKKSAMDSKISNAAFLSMLASQSNSISSADGEGSERNVSVFGATDGGDENVTDGRRMRTNIRPDQLRYLYERFRENTFPSCTELDVIAKAVDLNKPVVQIWFQNTRARERKKEQSSQGQHRRFKKRTCPICEESFHDKRALKEHVSTKHANKRSPLNKSQIGLMVEDTRDTFSRLSSAKSVGSWLNSTTNACAPVPGYPLPLSSFSTTADRQQIDNEVLRQTCLQYEESLKTCIEEYSKRIAGVMPVRPQSETIPPEARTMFDKASRELKSTMPSSKTRLEEAPLDLSMATRKSGDNETANRRTDSGNGVVQKPQYIDDSEYYSDNEDGNMGYEPGDAGSSFSQSSRNLYGPGSKRYRTQMSDLQIQVMRTIFTDSKMPTITECETLGHELGLPRRVVQVWFQNARAKEKKGVDGSKKSTDGSSQYGGGQSSGMLSNLGTDDKCSLCGTLYTAHDNQQDHLYSKGHVSKVKALLQYQERHSLSQKEDTDFPEMSSPALYSSG